VREKTVPQKGGPIDLAEKGGGKKGPSTRDSLEEKGSQKNGEGRKKTPFQRKEGKAAPQGERKKS